MADVLVHLRRLILILAIVYISGIVCQDLTCSLYPRPLSYRSKGRFYSGGGSSATNSEAAAGSVSGSGDVEEDSVPIEIPRKFHLQLWIYIYSFLIYAVLVNFTVL